MTERPAWPPTAWGPPPPPAPQPPPAPPARDSRRGKGLAVAGIVFGSLCLLGIATVAVVAGIISADRTDDGPVVAGGPVSATEVRTGDCPSTLPDSAARTLRVVACTEPHVAEVFASFPVSSGAYPGEAELKRFAGGGCTDRLAGFVGPGRQDEFDIVFFYPTDQSWRLGDRTVSCMVTAPVGSTLPTRSVRAG